MYREPYTLGTICTVLQTLIWSCKEPYTLSMICSHPLTWFAWSLKTHRSAAAGVQGAAEERRAGGGEGSAAARGGDRLGGPAHHQVREARVSCETLVGCEGCTLGRSEVLERAQKRYLSLTTLGSVRARALWPQCAVCQVLGLWATRTSSGAHCQAAKVSASCGQAGASICCTSPGELKAPADSLRQVVQHC